MDIILGCPLEKPPIHPRAHTVSSALHHASRSEGSTRLCLWFRSKQPAGAPDRGEVLSFKKQKRSFSLSKKHGRTRVCVQNKTCSRYVQTRKGSNNKRADPGFGPVRAVGSVPLFFFPSLPEVKRATFGLLEEFLVKTDTG